jgi:hypothetical protein
VTPEERQQIEQRLGEIALGDEVIAWEVCEPVHPGDENWLLVVRSGAFDHSLIAQVPHWLRENAEWIAAAPGLVRRLLDEVDRLAEDVAVADAHSKAVEAALDLSEREADNYQRMAGDTMRRLASYASALSSAIEAHRDASQRRGQGYTYDDAVLWAVLGGEPAPPPPPSDEIARLTEQRDAWRRAASALASWVEANAADPSAWSVRPVGEPAPAPPAEAPHDDTGRCFAHGFLDCGWCSEVREPVAPTPPTAAPARHPVTGRFLAFDCEVDCLSACAGLCGAAPSPEDAP